MKFGTAKAIVFDLGKVLIDFSVDRACAQVAQLIEVSPNRIYEFLFTDGREFAFERGLISFSELHREFETSFNTTVDAQRLAHAASDIFQPIDETIEILKNLNTTHRGKRPIILLSNTNEIHWQHIEDRWSVSKWFDDLVLSFEVKSMKPEEKIYQEAVKRSGYNAIDCFFVDDVPVNVEGARNIGMDAELFSGPDKLRLDLKARGIVI